MITQEPASTVSGDRRAQPRVEYVRPCKVFSPVMQKYFLGSTQDLSTGGMLVHIPHLVDVRPGDVLHVGVANKRREQFLRASEMLKVTVIRSLNTVDDHTTFAVRFEQPQDAVDATPIRLAA